MRAGPIISLASIYDLEKQKFRPVLYKGFVSELFVPYMDLDEEWYSRTYFDAGEYGFGLCAVSLEPMRDCPENAVFMDAYVVGQNGKPVKMSQIFCIFERHAGDIMWRHTETAIPRTIVSKILYYNLNLSLSLSYMHGFVCFSKKKKVSKTLIGFKGLPIIFLVVYTLYDNEIGLMTSTHFETALFKKYIIYIYIYIYIFLNTVFSIIFILF